MNIVTGTIVSSRTVLPNSLAKHDLVPRFGFSASRDFSTMPKAKQSKRNSASKANPYADAAAKTRAASSIFKMNTDIGQHVLKNPGIAQAIVDKAELKQSDVGVLEEANALCRKNPY